MYTEQLQPELKNSSVTSVDKRTNLSNEEFINDYVNKAIPVIVTDATKNWKEASKFTPQFFKENYPHISRQVKGVNYRMDDYIDLMLSATIEKPAPYPYNFDIQETFPELMKDFAPELVYGKMDRINHRLMPKNFLKGTTLYELFLGGNGSRFPKIHFDALYMNTQITQLYGSKDFFMFPPDQTPYMYPEDNNKKASRVNYFEPDEEQFPLFKLAKPIKFTLQEGETLFFPTGWWHTTQINEPSITFGRAQLNRVNWDAFINDNYLAWKTTNKAFAAGLVKAYGKVVGGIMDRQENRIKPI